MAQIHSIGSKRPRLGWNDDSLTVAAMALLTVGCAAPEVIAEADDGSEMWLPNLLSRYVIVYFYTRDESPGCTLAACNFNGGLYELEALKAEVIGIYTQDAEAHRRLRQNHGIHFPLSSDPNRATAQRCGVTRLLFGLLPANRRTSLLVDPDGKIAEVWPRVRPSGHYNEVLASPRRPSRRPAQRRRAHTLRRQSQLPRGTRACP